jgi:hypothetical protein
MHFLLYKSPDALCLFANLICFQVGVSATEECHTITRIAHLLLETLLCVWPIRHIIQFTSFK